MELRFQKRKQSIIYKARKTNSMSDGENTAEKKKAK